jgi:hypothetical protein
MALFSREHALVKLGRTFPLGDLGRCSASSRHFLARRQYAHLFHDELHRAFDIHRNP